MTEIVLTETVLLDAFQAAASAGGKVVLTVSRKKRQPQNDGYIAVISKGSPQLGDNGIVVLAVDIVPNMKAAKAWFERMKIEQP